MTNVDLVLVPIVTRLQLDAISTPVEELPGKVNLTTHSGLDLTIKIIDKSSGEIKYQGSEKTNSKTATRLVDSKVRPDFEALWDE